MTQWEQVGKAEIGEEKPLWFLNDHKIKAKCFRNTKIKTILNT